MEGELNVVCEMQGRRENLMTDPVGMENAAKTLLTATIDSEV